MARRLVAALLAGCLLLAGCAQEVPPAQGGPSASASQEGGAEALALTPLQCLYYDRSLFLPGAAAPAPYQAQGRLVAGMIPHHLVASDMLSGFFAMAAAQSDGYDRVILLSTSHFPERCGANLVTTRAEWGTPYGTVETDTALADALLANAQAGAEDNPDAMEFDHGVAGLMPYLAYYLPGVKVSACLLSTRLKASQQAALQQAVQHLCEDGRTLLLASVDCSHYLQPQQAVLRDEETARAIESFDWPAIATFTDSHVDSPQTLTVFLCQVEAAGASLAQLDHATSEDKLPQERSSAVFADGITTYFVYAAFLPDENS